MKKIIKFSDTIKNYIGLQEYRKDKNYIISPYVLMMEEETLLYNIFTCEMIKLEENELQYQYLVEHWFYFPDDIEPYSFVKSFKMIYKHMNKSKVIGNIQKYTIMTTMDCNARCPYCYESGRKKTTMDSKTASLIAQFIAQHAGPRVHITWFGGEPLLNTDIMTVITDCLNDENIYFTSSIITNGYLLGECDISDINFWRIKEAQITLDGTSDLYKETKNYIYDDEDPLSVVLYGIELLLDNGIKVNVRLNVSQNNVDSLHDLVDMLCEKFKDYTNFHIYTHPLFEETLEKINHGLESLSEHLKQYNIFNDYALASPKLLKNCMADSMNSIVITPKGDLTLCEHFSDEEIIGNIYEGITSVNGIKKWSKEYMIENCKTCSFYPQCTKLEKCPVSECTDLYRKNLQFQIQDSMVNVYRRAMEKNVKGNNL